MKQAERVHALLRRAILAGEHEPGARLKEEELAAATGASRTPVREALRRLASEGLVHVSPTGRAVVAGPVDADDLDALYEARAALEGIVARRAAERATAADVAAVRADAAAMEALATGAAPDRSAIAEANARLHRRLVVVADSARLSALLAQVVEAPLVLRTFARYDDAALRRSLLHHAELCDAVAAGDGPWAEAVMRTHVLAARAALRAVRR